MEPTARAIQIDGPIGAALEQVHLAFDHEFDPASLEQQFKIGLVNFGGMFILSALMQNLEMEAPKVQIAIEHMSEQLARDALNSADIDIAIGVLPDSRRNWSLQTLARDRSVLIARRDHPTIRDRISLADLAAARHVHVPICSPIDRTLARHGVRLHYAISSANPLIAPYIVGRTDLLAIVPENIARPSAEMFGLSIFEAADQAARLFDSTGQPSPLRCGTGASVADSVHRFGCRRNHQGAGRARPDHRGIARDGECLAASSPIALVLLPASRRVFLDRLHQVI